MFSRSRYDRQILALALPALGALAADPLVSLIDTAFVGRLGAIELAALGVNVSVFTFTFVIFNFLANGTTPLVGCALGRGDLEGAGRIVIQALVLAGLLGVAALVVLESLAAPLLGLMGADETMLAPALIYLRIRALAGPALLIITAANGAFRGFQDTSTPFLITLVLNAVNLMLDPLFIFGFGWGLAGAAWATVIAQWLGALWFLWLFAGSHRSSFVLRWQLPSPASFRPFLRIGWDLALRTTALIGVLTLATAVAARVGVVEVAAHQVAAQLWLFLALVVDALAVAAQALISKAMGESAPQGARLLSKRLLQWGLGVGLLLALSFTVLAPLLPRLFSGDAEVLAAVAGIFPFIIVMQPVNALVFVLDGIYIGVEAFGYLAKAMLVSALAASAVLLLTLPLGWGLSGVWWGLVCLMVVRLSTLAYRYFRYPHWSVNV